MLAVSWLITTAVLHPFKALKTEPMMRLVQKYASKTRLKDTWIALRTRRRAADSLDSCQKARRVASILVSAAETAIDIYAAEDSHGVQRSVLRSHGRCEESTAGAKRPIYVERASTALAAARRAECATSAPAGRKTESRHR